MSPTDRETIVAMFERAGVDWESSAWSVDDKTLVVNAISADDGPNRGWSDFYAEFGFNEDGSLAWVGAWE